ncbi:hypothetical protein D9M68_919350 [compost metagenome]
MSLLNAREGVQVVFRVGGGVLEQADLAGGGSDTANHFGLHRVRLLLDAQHRQGAVIADGLQLGDGVADEGKGVVEDRDGVGGQVTVGDDRHLEAVATEQGDDGSIVAAFDFKAHAGVPVA